MTITSTSVAARGGEIFARSRSRLEALETRASSDVELTKDMLWALIATYERPCSRVCVMANHETREAVVLIAAYCRPHCYPGQVERVSRAIFFNLTQICRCVANHSEKKAVPKGFL